MSTLENNDSTKKAQTDANRKSSYDVGPEGNAFHRTKPMQKADRISKRDTVFSATKIDLSVARSNEIFQIGGNVIWAFTASSSSAKLPLRFNERQGGDDIPFREGLALKVGDGFNQLVLNNSAQPGETMTLGTIFSKKVEKQVEGLVVMSTPSEVTQDVNINPGTTGFAGSDQVGANGTLTIISSNTGRRTVTVQSNPNNTTNVRVRHESGSNGEGIILQPGSSFTFGSSDSGFSPAIEVEELGGSNADIEWTGERD